MSRGRSRARGRDRHRTGFSRAGAARRADARGRGVLYAWACRPHSGHGRSAPAELYGVAREGGPIPLTPRRRRRRCWSASSTTPFRRMRRIPRARVRLEPLAERNCVSWRRVCRVPVLHGEMEIVGFPLWPRGLPDRRERDSGESFALLEGLDCWCFRRCATSRIPATPRWSRRSGGRGASARGRPGSRTLRTTWATKKPTARCRTSIALAYDGLTSCPRERSHERSRRSRHDSGLSFARRDSGGLWSVGGGDWATSTACTWGIGRFLRRWLPRRARRDARAVAITFDPHPEQFLRPAARRGC